jgi:hypothetical protein
MRHKKGVANLFLSYFSGFRHEKGRLLEQAAF